MVPGTCVTPSLSTMGDRWGNRTAHGEKGKFMLFRFNNVSSVSYTHLDVYKRQVFGCVAVGRVCAVGGMRCFFSFVDQAI